MTREAAGGVGGAKEGRMTQVRRDAFVLLIVCVALVASCTTHGRVGVLPAVPDTEQVAEIVVIREWRYLGGGANVTISLDGVALYGIAVDEHVVLRVPPGDHIVTISRRGPFLNDAATAVRTEPKRRYYYRLETSTGLRLVRRMERNVLSNWYSLANCASGETGRRAGLRIQWGNPWEFKSPLAHQLLSKHARAGLSVKNAKLSAITVRPPWPRPGAAA